MKRAIKAAISSFVVGVLSLGLAWAGAVSTPPLDAGRPAAPAQQAIEVETASTPQPARFQRSSAISLPAGQVLAGAAKVSIEPRPKAYDGEWETDKAKCQTLGSNPDGIREGATHALDVRVRWHENPNCLYMGGYGLGPMNPITNWNDRYGLSVRSAAIGDGKDVVVLTLLDAAYYFGKYNSMCNGRQDCGFFDLQKAMAEKLHLPASSFLFAATHSHTAPDFIGAWGGVPKWYMQQVEDSIKASVRAAVASMRPATLEIGEAYARQFSSERRDFYHSAEDQNLAWARAVSGDGRAVFTLGAFAAHPVTEDVGSGTADADFSAVFSHAVEQRWGGVGLLFQTGLGNISPRPGRHPQGESDKEKIGFGLASLIPDIGGGRRVEHPNVKTRQRFWNQPVTNTVLTSLGAPGFFDRPFNGVDPDDGVSNAPVVRTGENPERRPCISASPVWVRTAVSAVKIGELWITGGPGELFANLTNTIKEKNPTGVTMPLSLVNDGLGYIMQSFETDHGGRQGAGFVGQVVEYEDAYSIDHCIGDATLEHTLKLLRV